MKYYILKKIDHIISKYELKHRKCFLFSLPKTIQLEFTTKCPLNCIMCARKTQKFNKNGFMNKNVLKRSIPFIKYAKNVIVAGYGEPLIHKNFFKYIDIINKYNKNINLITSASFIKKNTAKLLKKHNISKCTISFDALDETIYRSIRGISNKKIIEFIYELNDLGIKIAFNIVVMRKNLSDITNIIEKFKFIKELYLYHPKIYSKEIEKENLLYNYNKKNIREFLKETKILCNDNNIKLFPFPELNSINICSQPLNSIFIKYNGNVLGCCSATYLTNKYNIYAGNILKNNIFSIWNNKVMIKFRKAFYGKKSYPLQCKNCAFRITTLDSYKRV